jgi:RNA polymerase sigma-70 factor (ECF subfamily)
MFQAVYVRMALLTGCSMNWQSLDQDYVDRLIAGDAEVQEHFTEYFGGLLMVKLRHRVRSPQLRDDIIQETFLRLFAFLRKGKGLEHPERLGAFVMTTCMNVAMEHFRAEGRHDGLPDHLSDPADGSIDAESILVNEQRNQQVSRILETLPVKDRILLRQIFFEERDKDEICREMKVGRDYFRVLLFRAKSRFKDGLAKSATAFALFFM